MDCERHPGQTPIGGCLECGKGICSQCVIETDQVLVCPECFQKEIDRLAAAMGTARGKAPRARKEKAPKARKPKKEELPAAPEVAPPPPVIPQQAVTPLLDAVPSEELRPLPVEALPAYGPPPEGAFEASPVAPVEEMPVKPKGKARKERPPKVKKEKPPKVKKERPPKARKSKKGEMPAPPEVPPPTVLAAVEEAPPVVAPPPPFVPPTTGVPLEEEAPPAYEPTSPEAPPVEAEAVPLPEAPPTFEGAAEPQYAPPPFYEEAPPVPQPEYEQPPAYEPPAYVPPSQEVPVDEGLPAGFDEGEGMMEQVRPEHVTREEYMPTPEYQEILGEPREEAVAPWEDTGEAEPVEGISEVTVAPAEEAGVPGEEWPIEEAPVPEALGEPTPPPPTPPPFEGPGQAETVEPAVEGEVVDVSGEEEYGVKVEETEPPGRQIGTQEELHSFFFEDEIDKKGKDQKGDRESFWE